MSNTQVSVHYERKFSDGNYGSEGLSASWTVTYEDDGDLACDPSAAEARVHMIGETLRTAVLLELGNSQAYQVARAAKRELETPEEKATWKQAEASAEYELAAGLRDNAREQSDDLEELPY